MVDYTLDNQPGASFRAELNLILAALAENAYDATEPTTTFPGQWWVDAGGASPVIKMRNAADSAWVTVGTLDAGAFQLAGTTAFTRSLLDDADAATARATLGVAMEFIESQDASASATLDFTNFDATKFDAYEFVFSNIIPAFDGALQIRTSTDGGVGYDSGPSDYGFAHTGLTFSGTALDSNSATQTSIPLGNLNIENTGDGVSGTVRVLGPHLAKDTNVTFLVAGETVTATGFTLSGGGQRNSSADVDAIRFLFTSGNITSGTITMYGLRNS